MTRPTVDPAPDDTAAVDFDDLSREQAVNDLVAFYGACGAIDRVHFNPRWNGWVLTGYDDVAWAFRFHEQLPSDRFEGAGGRRLRPEGQECP